MSVYVWWSELSLLYLEIVSCLLNWLFVFWIVTQSPICTFRHLFIRSLFKCVWVGSAVLLRVQKSVWLSWRFLSIGLDCRPLVCQCSTHWVLAFTSQFMPFKRRFQCQFTWVHGQLAHKIVIIICCCATILQTSRIFRPICLLIFDYSRLETTGFDTPFAQRHPEHIPWRGQFSQYLDKLPTWIVPNC